MTDSTRNGIVAVIEVFGCKRNVIPFWGLSQGFAAIGR